MKFCAKQSRHVLLACIFLMLSGCGTFTATFSQPDDIHEDIPNLKPNQFWYPGWWKMIVPPMGDQWMWMTGTILSCQAEKPYQYCQFELNPLSTKSQATLSGSYMLEQLKNKSSGDAHFIGDAAFQQLIVQWQVIAETGQRYLNGYTDNQTQYKALMDAGIAAAPKLGLTVGTALSDAQASQLSSDIVWLVDQVITLPDGSLTKPVLDPHLYLAPSHAR